MQQRPPLDLEVGVRTPDGRFYRWGLDDQHRPQNQPQDLTFSTAMPGGFDSMSCTLARDPKRDYPDIVELSRIQVRGLGGEIAWEGRLEQLPDSGGSTSQLSPQAVGYQSALDDDGSAAMIYIDQALSNWSDPPLTRQLALANAGYTLGSQSTATDASGNPAVVLDVSDSWATNVPVAEAWYDAGICTPVSCFLSMALGANVNGADPNWVINVFSADDPAGGLTSATVPPTAGEWPGVDGRYLALQQYYNATSGGTDGLDYQTFWKPVVFGDHGLPVGYPGAPTGILASDVMRHAVRAWAPEIATSRGGVNTITPSVFPIGQLAFTSPTTVSVIVKQVAQYEDLDWGVLEGPTFWAAPFGELPTSRAWRTRVGQCQLQQTGPNVSRLYNGVVVSFTASDGSTQVVGPPGLVGATATDATLVDNDPQNLVNEAGIKRWAYVQMGTSTPAGAIAAGAQYLQAQKVRDTSGQASLVGYVQDAASGIWWPHWMVRGGDTLAVVDAKDPSPRRIVSTSCDGPSKTNTVQLDQPPDTSTALLQRMIEAIAPLGLS